MASERRYCAVVEYDGTDYLGYQIQAQGRTVQGTIEESLTKVTRLRIRINGAGRTDAGVHATGQVIAFDAAWRHSPADLQRALNAVLPSDIIVSRLKIVDKTFHPRFSALSRSYRYTIVNQPWPSVLERRYAYHLRERLNVAVMNQASQHLLGAHDFASFGKPPQGNVTVRTITQANWSTSEHQVRFDITANAFLYRMVRRIVATLVKVGLEQWTITEFDNIIAARDLTRSAPPAPAHGLCLRQVIYSEEI